jgi:hypothetical protein
VTPPLDKPDATSPPAQTPEDLNSPEALARATERLHALGVDGEIVFAARTPEELRAFLRSRPECATST